MWKILIWQAASSSSVTLLLLLLMMMLLHLHSENDSKTDSSFQSSSVCLSGKHLLIHFFFFKSLVFFELKPLMYTFLLFSVMVFRNSLSSLVTICGIQKDYPPFLKIYLILLRLPSSASPLISEALCSFRIASILC